MGKEFTGLVATQSAKVVRLTGSRDIPVQWAVISGIKCLCQSQLAWMNLDPDAVLFGMHLPEMGTTG